MEQPEQSVAPQTSTEDVVDWPNKTPVVDGIEPTAETSQDPEFIVDEDNEDLEMEV